MTPIEKCEIQEASSGAIYYLGLIVFSWILFKVFRSLWRGFYTCILADLLGATVDWKKLPKWAIVTGATDGIGKAYAKALAKKGFNIVLISRTKEKLEAVATEIGKQNSVETRIIAVDFTEDNSIYDTIREKLHEFGISDIGVLVNNVGMSYKYAEYLTKIVDGTKFSDDAIKANITSCTRMTQMILPYMEKFGKGVILNISSLSALSPVPLLSIYSACKVYVNFFTKAVQNEYLKKGIIIQSVLPGFVSTNMSKMRVSFTTCSPEAFVHWALKTVGVEQQTYGYPVHKLQGYLQELLCQYVPENINLAINHKMMSTIRKKYYKKFGLVDDDRKKK